MPRWLPWLLPLVGLALAAPALWRSSPLAGSAAAEDATRRALAEGNRLVRDGELEPAVEAYAAGWGEAAAGDDDLAGVLAYNLGTTLHRLDRRPEALLWYRRAQPLRPGDRWLADNLALVRGELAAPRRPPPGIAARLAARRRPLATAAVAAAWAALALLALRRPLEDSARGPRWAPPAAGGAALGLGLASLLLWTAPAAAAVAGPRPAVVLAACAPEATAGRTPSAAAGEAGEPAEPAASDGQRGEGATLLPPGSEVWVRPLADGGWRIAGETALVCPGEAVGLIAAPGAGWTALL